MNEKLRGELIELARAEDAMRADVPSAGDVDVLVPSSVLVGSAGGELIGLRREHNTRLREIINAHDWPGASMVREDGCEAAWRLAMFALDDRELQGRCLMLLEDITEEGEVQAWQPAFLLDRLLAQDGKDQFYGSQLRLADDGTVTPFPIANPGGVDARRAAIGVPPLADHLASVSTR